MDRAYSRGLREKNSLETVKRDKEDGRGNWDV